MEVSHTKIALIREPGYPIGYPAPLYAQCICGAKIINIEPSNKDDIGCILCDRHYTPTGWLK